MKIKTKKKMRLDELIEYKKNGTKRDIYEVFKCDDGLFEVRMSGSCLDYVRRNGFGHQNELPNMPFHTLFTVEVEEELTEETVIRGLADVFFDPLVGGPNVEFHIDCIKNIKQDAMETYSLAIFYKDTLVWSRESGIPEDGVLEVDTDE